MIWKKKIIDDQNDSPMKKYQVTLTKEQLMLIAQCVEDCHRFACGQTELWNTTSQFNIKDWNELRTRLQNLKSFVTPELEYSWDGYGCEDDHQRKFIAKTYAIYREILHKVVNDGVYTSPTLTCEEGGELPIIEELEE